MVTLTDKQLAEVIGKEVSAEGRIYWKYEDLPEIRAALRAMRLTSADGSFLIDGTMPYWLYLAILASLAPKQVLLNTPNYGPVEIPQNVPQGKGSGVVFSAYEDEQFTLIQFTTPRSLAVDQLSTIVPPVVNPEKGVIISSNAPYWIIGTVALAYAKARWVACSQKFGGAIVAISNDKSTALGTEIEKSQVTQAVERAGMPKRGEIWVFDSEHGEHPGLILSPDERNASSGDVLLVPFTTQSKHADRYLQVAPASTGLVGVCYAKYSNITKVEKTQLVGGPIGRATDELMSEIVRHVRLAIGDAA